MSWRTDLLGLGSSDTSSPGQYSCGTKEAHTVPPSKLVLPWVSNNSSLRAYLVSHVVTPPLSPGVIFTCCLICVFPSWLLTLWLKHDIIFTFNGTACLWRHTTMKWLLSSLFHLRYHLQVTGLCSHLWTTLHTDSCVVEQLACLGYLHCM